MQHVVLPLTVREGVLRVAVADPVDVVALDDLRMRAQGLRLEVVVAAESQLRDKIAELWSQVVTEDALEKFVSELSIDEEVSLEAGDDEGAVAAVHQILSAAVRAGASDVHIEPMRDGRAGPGPHRRHPASADVPAPQRALLDRGAHEDRVGTGHRGAARPAGRSRPAARRRP